MKQWILFLMALTVNCMGFARTPQDFNLYASNGKQKAIVAVMPVIDHSGESNSVWNLSYELTNDMRGKVFDSSKLYLLRDVGSLELSNKLNAPDLTEIRKSNMPPLGAAEFVIVTELLEHRDSPYGSKSIKTHEAGRLLSLAMRVRVIDMRKEEPKVILQEIIHHDNALAMAYKACSPESMENFARTPLGMAHHKLICEAIARAEGYIEAAR